MQEYSFRLLVGWVRSIRKSITRFSTLQRASITVIHASPHASTHKLVRIRPAGPPKDRLPRWKGRKEKPAIPRTIPQYGTIYPEEVALALYSLRLSSTLHQMRPTSRRCLTLNNIDKYCSMLELIVERVGNVVINPLAETS